MRTFHKTCSDPEAAYRKYELMHQASLQSDAFSSPRPVSLDVAAGSIELEWISDVRPVSEILPGANLECALGLSKTIGRSLGELHDSWQMINVEAVLDLPGITEPGIFDNLGPIDEQDLVLGHGDFGLGNILGQIDDPSHVVIIDPEPAPFLTLPTAFRTRPELDLAHFCSCLEGVFPVRYYPVHHWRALGKLRTELIEAYGTARSVDIDHGDVHRVTLRLVSAFAHWLTRPERKFSNRMLGRFLAFRSRNS